MNATVAIETITPELARELLATNLPAQRKLRQSHVFRLAKEMENDTFLLSPDAVLIIKGQLANAQHRLAAVDLSGKPQQFLVLRTEDESVFKIVDSGLRRTVADAIGKSDYSTVMASVVALVVAYDMDVLSVAGSSSSPAMTRSLLVDYATLHDEALRDQIAFCQIQFKNKTFVRPAFSAALLHLAERHIPNCGRPFIESLANGKADDVTFDLRERLIKNAGSKAKLPRPYIFGLMIKAYNAYQKGQRPGVLKLVDGDKFPKIPLPQPTTQAA